MAHAWQIAGRREAELADPRGTGFDRGIFRQAVQLTPGLSVKDKQMPDYAGEDEP